MIELFPDIPERVRKQTAFIVDIALSKNDPLSAVKILNEYTNSCYTEEERNFVQFYFKMKMEQMKNEG